MNANQPQVVLFVAGMHRSGTSVFTRLLNLLGADVGDRLLGSCPGINDKGFWEHEELVALDEAALGRMGRTWYDFGPWPVDWAQGAEWDELLERMRAFLRHGFPQAPLAALKDPRLCRLLPLWLRALEGGPWDPRVLLVLRDPAQIAASLARRDPLAPEVSALLWLAQMRDADLASRGLPRALASYDELFEDWPGAVARMAQALGLQWPVAPAAIAEQVAQEVDPGLRHHRAADASVDPGPFMALARQGYRALRDGGDVDSVWQRFAAAMAAGEDWTALLQHTQRQLFEQTVRLQDCGEDLGAARQTVAQRDAAIQGVQHELARSGRAHREALDTVEERDAQIQKLAGEHAHALAVIAEKDRQTTAMAKEKDEQIEYATAVVRERDGQLADLHARIQRVRRIPLLGPLYRWLMRPRPQ